MTTIFILDIDGTVANNDHRARLLYFECHQCLTGVDGLTGEDQFECPHCNCYDARATDASWDRFNDVSLMAMDTPIVRAQKCVKILESLGHPVHYLTARGPEQHAVTLSWLQAHFNFDDSKQLLFTRDTKDERIKSHQFKEEAVKKIKHILGQEYENPKYVFVDDKHSNLKMFKKHGVSLRAPHFWNSMIP